MVWVADDGQVREVRPNVGGAVLRDVSPGGKPPESMDHLDVDEMRSMKIAVPGQPSGQLLVSRSAGQDGEHG